MNCFQIVLASSSRHRMELLAAAGIACLLVPPEVDENSIMHREPLKMAMKRALAKARDVTGRIPLDRSTILIAADQVAHVDGVVLGKPLTVTRHLRMLRLLRGRSHQITTAMVVADNGGSKRSAVTETGQEHSASRWSYQSWHVTTRLLARDDLTDQELLAYVHSGEGRFCGGGYQVERRGIQLFRVVDGDWTNVVGLPLPSLISVLRGLGWRPFGSGERLAKDSLAGRLCPRGGKVMRDGPLGAGY